MPIRRRGSTVTLTGDATISDVKTGKTFYSNDPDSKLTGTHEEPELTGDATEEDVVSGKTFYSDDPENKLTGTLVSEKTMIEKIPTITSLGEFLTPELQAGTIVCSYTIT